MVDQAYGLVVPFPFQYLFFILFFSLFFFCIIKCGFIGIGIGLGDWPIYIRPIGLFLLSTAVLQNL